MLKKINLLVCFLILSRALLGDNIDIATTKRLDVFAQRAYSTLPTIYNTYELAAQAIKNGIPGDFVECGVAAGSQVAAMAFACQNLNIIKTIHLFDSFEGIPLASGNDTEQPGIGKIQHNTNVANLNELLISSNVTVCSLEQVQRNMREWEIDSKLLRYHKGWFQYTLPVVASEIKQISFLRLDGDLYESTKVCLEYLYPKVVPGGYVVIDDFALAGCRKAVLEYLTTHDLKVDMIEVVGGQGPIYWQVE